MAGAFFYEFVRKCEYRIMDKSAIASVEDAINVGIDAINVQIDAIPPQTDAINRILTQLFVKMTHRTFNSTLSNSKELISPDKNAASQ